MVNILVTRSSMPSMDEYIKEIEDIWDSHWLTNMGPKHKEFQKNLKEYLKVEQMDMFTNGHMEFVRVQIVKRFKEIFYKRSAYGRYTYPHSAWTG